MTISPEREITTSSPLSDFTKRMPAEYDTVPADFASTLEATAARDAAAWVEKLRDCKLI